MSLRQALILAINTAILSVLFVFTTWLYLGSRSEVDAEVEASLDRAAAVTDNLARMREAELSALAAGLAAGPMLRAAAATGDVETVEDVLRAVAEGNALAWAVLAKGGVSRYAGPPGLRGRPTAELTAGKLAGHAPSGDLELWLAEEPAAARLESWSSISSARYGVRSPGAVTASHNLPAEDAELQGRPVPPGRASVVEAKNAYYARSLSLLEGRLAVALYAPRAPFWKRFERRRNSLVVLGGSLFFLGLLLSVAFAGLIERVAAVSASPSGEEWLSILDRIEAAKGRK